MLTSPCRHEDRHCDEDECRCSPPLDIRQAERRARGVAENHKPADVPPCRVCGGVLSIARIGGGEPTKWACQKSVEGPSVDYDHYGRSAFEDRRHVDPEAKQVAEDYLALLKFTREELVPALEKIRAREMGVVEEDVSTASIFPGAADRQDDLFAGEAPDDE